MKKLFDEQDFSVFEYGGINAIARLADAANKKLTEAAANWPTVYGTHVPSESGLYWFTPKRHEADKFQAKLAFIEEIPGVACEHEPLDVFAETAKLNKSTGYRPSHITYVSLTGGIDLKPGEIICRKCNKKLKAVAWEAADGE